MRKIVQIMGNLTFLEPDTFKQVLALSKYLPSHYLVNVTRFLICLYKLSASYLFFKT